MSKFRLAGIFLVLAFLPILVYAQEDDVDGNTECPEGVSYIYNSAYAYGYVTPDRKVNLYGKSCVSIEADEKAAVGKCIAAKKCFAQLCDGKPCALPKTDAQTAGSNPLQNTTTLKPAEDLRIPETNSGSSVIDDSFAGGPEDSFTPDSRANSAKTLEAQLLEAIKREQDSGGSWIGEKYEQVKNFFTGADAVQLQPGGLEDSTTISAEREAEVTAGSTFGNGETNGEVSASCDSWTCWAQRTWASIKDGSAFGIAAEAKPSLVGADNKISATEFYKIAYEKFENSSLNGYAPEWGKKFGIDGTPESWARFATQLARQESGLRVAEVNADGSLKRFATTLPGEQSYGPLQFNVGEYGLKTWSDVNNPSRTIDALIQVAEKGKIEAYFGSVQRPNEVTQHNAWFNSNVAPNVRNVAEDIPLPQARPEAANIAFARDATRDVVAQPVSLAPVAITRGPDLADINPWASVNAGTYVELPPQFLPFQTAFQYQPEDLIGTIQPLDTAPYVAYDSAMLQQQIIAGIDASVPQLDDLTVRNVALDIQQNLEAQIPVADIPTLNAEQLTREIQTAVAQADIPMPDFADSDGMRITAEIHTSIQESVALAEAERAATLATLTDVAGDYDAFNANVTWSLERWSVAQLELGADISNPDVDVTQEIANENRIALDRIETQTAQADSSESEDAAERQAEIERLQLAERIDRADLETDAYNAGRTYQEAAQVTPADSTDTRTETLQVSDVPRQSTYSKTAIDLQEKVLRESLQDQTVALQEMSATLNDDAVARGIEACATRAASPSCQRYQSYSVAVQTEQAKYDEVRKNFESFQEFKQTGNELALNDNLQRSLGEIQKGQGERSIAFTKAAQPYKEYVGEWWSSLTGAYKESDWGTVAGDIARGPLALGSGLYGSALDTARSFGERFLPEAAGFAPSPEAAARCGAVGQGFCDTEAAVNAGILVTDVGGIGTGIVRGAVSGFGRLGSHAGSWTDNIAGDVSGIARRDMVNEASLFEHVQPGVAARGGDNAIGASDTAGAVTRLDIEDVPFAANDNVSTIGRQQAVGESPVLSAAQIQEQLVGEGRVMGGGTSRVAPSETLPTDAKTVEQMTKDLIGEGNVPGQAQRGALSDSVPAAERLPAPQSDVDKLTEALKGESRVPGQSAQQPFKSVLDDVNDPPTVAVRASEVDPNVARQFQEDMDWIYRGPDPDEPLSTVTPASRTSELPQGPTLDDMLAQVDETSVAAPPARLPRGENIDPPGGVEAQAIDRTNEIANNLNKITDAPAVPLTSREAMQEVTAVHDRIGQMVFDIRAGKINPDSAEVRTLLDTEVKNFETATTRLQDMTQSGSLRATVDAQIRQSLNAIDEQVRTVKQASEGLAPQSTGMQYLDEVSIKLENMKNKLIDVQSSLPEKTYVDRVQIAAADIWYGAKNAISDVRDNYFSFGRTVPENSAPRAVVDTSANTDELYDQLQPIAGNWFDNSARGRTVSVSNAGEEIPPGAITGDNSFGNIRIPYGRDNMPDEDLFGGLSSDRIVTNPVVTRADAPADSATMDALMGSFGRRVDTGEVAPQPAATPIAANDNAWVQSLKSNAAGFTGVVGLGTYAAWRFPNESLSDVSSANNAMQYMPTDLSYFGGPTGPVTTAGRGEIYGPPTETNFIEARVPMPDLTLPTGEEITEQIRAEVKNTPTAPPATSPAAAPVVPPADPDLTTKPAVTKQTTNPFREPPVVAPLRVTDRKPAAVGTPDDSNRSGAMTGRIFSFDTHCVKEITPVIVHTVPAGTPFPSDCYNNNPNAFNAPSSFGGSSSLTKGISQMLGSAIQKLFGTNSTQRPATPNNQVQPTSTTSTLATPIQPIVSLIPNPATIEMGGTSVLVWASVGVQSCDILTPERTKLATGKPEGRIPTARLATTTVFTAECDTVLSTKIYATTTVTVK